VNSKSRHKEPSYSVDKKTTSRFLKRNLIPPKSKPNPWRASKNNEIETDDDNRVAHFKKT
jgi:hypothetical protein